MKLHTVISSVRPTRIGPTIARWFNDYAVKHGKFDAELIDLVDFKLPVHDEPEHPRAGNYVHEHTKAWSKSVASKACRRIKPRSTGFAIKLIPRRWMPLRRCLGLRSFR